ncbi:MAG: restriction endonuclease [Spirochaetes bacterium GWD1_27_9]|nr:MAG: restriction endonuclease [Spirochaetes bacterium GWB1_27_13]OHD21426.1 MAG: restriction endonuclease [Spirochaetes bacterium GWC1_27_15]OHD28627.1 MAG: restriction endonuclease [Spirochaetes bacterium GWD1_27_9]
MQYSDYKLKNPIENKDYPIWSAYAIEKINKIVQKAIDSGENKIFIRTNLKMGLPMENINKIAGPFIEAWAYETFLAISDDPKNPYKLVNVEAKERLYMADVILVFKLKDNPEQFINAEVDVKATAEDIKDSGKSPNITSYARIRTAYVEDPDYLFIILSIKHKVYATKNFETKMFDGIMEVTSFNAYDLKYMSSSDISYNPALGTGQIQLRDIHYVDVEKRTTFEFCKLLDTKYLNSSKRSINDWYDLASKNGWIKEDV